MADIGGQPGNQNAVKNRPWRAAVDRALQKKSLVAKADALEIIAETVVEAAMRGPSYVKGDPWPGAVAELADRLDGKPKQQIEATGADDGPLRIIHESK
jgi:hypothetical protein